MSEILDKIVALTENNKIIWHRNLRRQCYHARYTCGMHVIYISLDLHPFSTAEKRIVRFWTSHPNLLQSNFNDVGPFFDVSEKLAAALEKQLGKKLE